MRGRIIRHTIGQEHKNSEEVWLSHWEIMYLPTHSTRNEKKQTNDILIIHKPEENIRQHPHQNAVESASKY